MTEKLTSSEPLEEEQLLEYKNSKLPIDDRVADLLNRMTLEEKVAQMLCIWGQKKKMLFDKAGNLNLEKLGLHFSHGLGQKIVL